MTVYSQSPKKANAYNGQKWSESRRWVLHRKYWWVWILLALLPFLVMRVVFFYASPQLLYGTSTEIESDLRMESAAVPYQTSHKHVVREPFTRSVLTPTWAPPAEWAAELPPEEMVVPVRDVSEPPKQEFGLTEEPQDDAGLPEDNETKSAESWQAPPEESKDVKIAEVASDTSGSVTTPPDQTGECDLYDGDWVHDAEGPLYTNATCFYIQSNQNCMKNGRPDTEFMYWKWVPTGCDLPRFNAKEYLQWFRGKTIGYVGDSLSRNQMQSLLCMLSQVEVPDMIFQDESDQKTRWYFKDYQVTLAAVWSPYLLKETTAEMMGIAEGQSKLYLDKLDPVWTSVLSDFDVVVLSIGQWFYKSSVYLRNESIIGCHYCPGLNFTEVGFVDAYRSALRLVLDKITTDYKGVAIMSTFALEHFEGGRWNDGGSCMRRQPLQRNETLLDGQNFEMHETVIEEYEKSMMSRNKWNDKVQLGLLDVSKLSLRRPDGHPGPYRVFNPFANSPPGAHVQNDCLHWCLPGPVDTWNQFLVKIVQSVAKWK